MRSLTIKREKRFAGCLAKMKIYIEDADSKEIIINDISYRKLGDIKNGEEKIFAIDENERNIIIIADQASKNYCNDIYRIPAGENDVFLSGKNVLNLATGNAFRFNGVTDSSTLQNRKKGLNIGIIILCIALVFGAVGGFLITNSLLKSLLSKPENFSKEGMTITLTNRFHEISREGYTTCYDSKDVAVFVLKEEFSLAEGFDKYTLDDYGNLLITNNNLDPSVKLQNNNGLTYFEYQYKNPDTNDQYHYFSVVSKTSDSFWMIQFATLEQNFDDNKQAIIDWAKNIKFANS